MKKCTTKAEVKEVLYTLTKDQLEKLACVIFYDLELEEIQSQKETKARIIKDLMANVVTYNGEEDGDLDLIDGEVAFWTREAKPGDDAAFSKILASMETGNNWKEMKW